MASPELILFARAISRLLGWSYFLAWSASFYPQPLLCLRTRSTRGLAIDFPTLNILGFACYALSTGLFLFNPTVRRQYAWRHPAAPEPTVRLNDFVFALHGAVLCVVVYSMFWRRVWGFSVAKEQKASLPIKAIFWLGVAFILGTVGLCLTSEGKGYDPSTWAWIDVMYALGYVKLAVTITKYIPQAWVNFKRRSTHGWSIAQILFDVAGGVLSLAQLVIDSALEGDWSGVTGNPAKFWLGNVTVLFDVVFIVQHFVLYRGAGEKGRNGEEEEGERERLLGA